jgi:uncharacterized membrane protein YfcA
MSDAWRIVLTILLGFGTGVLSGMFGIGGAVVSTPGIRVLGATPIAAIGSTVPSIIPSAITGAYRYSREHLVDWRVVAWTGLTGAAAAVGGAFASGAVPGGGHPLMILTALMVGFTAWRLSRPVTTPEPEPVLSAEGATDAAPGLARPAEGPARLEAWRLTVTGMACVGVLAIPSMITHALLGHINWLYALPLCVGVVPGARLGAHLTIRSSDQTLRVLVGIVLGLIAIVYAAGEILALT